MATFAQDFETMEKSTLAIKHSKTIKNPRWIRWIFSEQTSPPFGGFSEQPPVMILRRWRCTCGTRLVANRKTSLPRRCRKKARSENGMLDFMWEWESQPETMSSWFAHLCFLWLLEKIDRKPLKTWLLRANYNIRFPVHFLNRTNPIVRGSWDGDDGPFLQGLNRPSLRLVVQDFATIQSIKLWFPNGLIMESWSLSWWNHAWNLCDVDVDGSIDVFGTSWNTTIGNPAINFKQLPVKVMKSRP